MPNLLTLKVRKQAEKDDLASPRHGSLLEEFGVDAPFFFFFPHLNLVLQPLTSSVTLSKLLNFIEPVF